MSTESEIKLARYSETAKEADSFGRVIGVRRLKPSEQTKIAGMTAELSGYDEMLNEKGVKVQIPHRMPLLLAAAVCLIDDAHIPFPRNRGELDAIYDRLDTEGIEAAGKAWIKLNPPADDPEISDTQDETKNL